MQYYLCSEAISVKYNPYVLRLHQLLQGCAANDDS